MIDDYYRKLDADEEFEEDELTVEKRSLGRRLKRSRKGNHLVCFEVDFEYFQRHFW